jgi:7,8-dihydropterin-6-yl-methyl-4-(beta-D-ribofuranosyl)aminobenzene 5'-phosphate synthase
VKITALSDNRTSNYEFECEHGLSLLIEVENKKILMDTGQSQIYKNNAIKLGINLNDVDYIVLSHGDYDHGNGLKYFDKKVELICHPYFSCYRISKRTGKFDGLNQTREELNKRFLLKESKDPYSITENIIFLGQIERKNSNEINLPMIDEKGNDYEHLDDSGLAIKTEKGLVIISGCAHSGICNTVEYAKKITGENNILAVVGGFHLKEVNENTIKTMEYMKNNDVKNIFLAHCTSDVVCNAFSECFPDSVKIIKVGLEYKL